jgi:hypothetical protein
MTKHIFTLFLGFLFTSHLHAETPKLGLKHYNILRDDNPRGEESFWSRVSFGGNIGLQLGNPTNILISPSLGYIPKAEFLDNKLMLGFGVTYMYYRIRSAGFTSEANIYGGRLFARYLILPSIFAYSEFESLNAPNFALARSPREWANSLFLGGGYLMRISERGGGIMITALYNVLWDYNHIIYSSPWNFRLGFMI